MSEPTFELKDFDDLAEDARRLISEGIQRGTMTLESGKVVTLDGKVFADLVKWVASLKKGAPKLVNTPEDFQLRQTRSEK